MDTEIKIDEPRRDDCEAYRIVLLDGERNGEIKVIRLGSPERRYVNLNEGGKAAFVKGREVPPKSQGQAVGAQKRVAGVRVLETGKASDDESKKRRRKEKTDSKVKEEENLRRDLDNSIAEGSFTTASSSIVSSYSTPFALALGASNTEIGLLNSVQSLAGILSQLPGAWFTRRMTRKRIWTLCTLASRVFLIPLIFMGLFLSDAAEIWLLIALLGLVSFFSSMRGPAWSSMMGDIVPQDRRGRYFGNRNMIIGAAGMVATLAAGAAVYLWGFPSIFAAAIILSLISIAFFSRIREPELRQEKPYHYRLHFHPSDLLLQIRTNRNFAVFTAYMTAVNFSVNIAAPFVAVYMLKDLDIGYGWFAILVTVGALVQVASMRYWGSRCDRYGNRKILVISGILICFVPLGYILSSNVWELLLLKIYDGFVWGAFDLVVFNYLLGVTPSEKRPTFIANHNFMAGAGTVAGALFGAYLAESFQVSGISVFFGLQAVFLVSLVLRLGSTAFLPKIAEAETKECVPVRYVFWETVAVGPAKGMEHAITSAFRYPYGKKIKSSLGIKEERKIKLSTSSFCAEAKRKQKAAKGTTDGAKANPKAISIKKEVFGMALMERKPSNQNGSEYMELGYERQSPKTAKIVVHNLQRFAETDKIVKNIKSKNVVFVGLKAIKQTNMDDLKQSVAKINRACMEANSNLSLVEDEWLIVTPISASIV